MKTLMIFTRGIHTEELFRGLKAMEGRTFYQHLNAHNVIYVNFSDYFGKDQSAAQGIASFSSNMIKDLNQAFPDILGDIGDLALALDMICQVTGEKFIFLVDEWDCIFRLRRGKKEEQEEFLEFLRTLFKDKSYLELVYMTGILPIKKYSTGSALNMFREFTMLEPKRLSPYFGFTEGEVAELCREQDKLSLEELKEWYDGYAMGEWEHIYNPRSVTEALTEGKCCDYWNKTGGYSELEEYITRDFDGLGEAVTQMLAGEETEVSVLGFSNDLDSFQNKDEVITALVHLGYLTCSEGKVRIPNREIAEAFANSVKKLSWGTVTKLLRQSKELLAATCGRDAAKVAALLESVHDDMHEFKEYNSEHTLKCVIHLAYYAAQDEYRLRFEEGTGKGIADCLMLPKRRGIPGIVLELKYNRSAEEAVAQIRQKNYAQEVLQVADKVLLVGINYDKGTKEHQCIIEEI
ncbi:MAG: ATP-binding protein [Acetatifactor sp.]|nr:ATP-binding protein [Acetatifactor sp.]